LNSNYPSEEEEKMDHQRFEEKWGAEVELSTTKREVLFLIESIETLRSAAQKSKTAVKCFYSTSRIIVNEQEEIQDPVEYKRLKKVAEQAEHNLAEAENKRLSLEGKVRELEQKLAGFAFNVSQKEIALLQSTKNTLADKIGTIKEVLSQKEEERATVFGEDATHLPDLITRKEALLAEEALGKKITPGSIEAIDQQLISLEEKYAESSAEDIKLAHVISGLNTELSNLEEEFLFLNKQYSEAFFSFLRLEAEKIGRQYAKHAKGLTESYLKITAIERVMTAHGSVATFIGAGSGSLDIPGLNLPKCQGEKRFGERDYIFQSKTTSPQQEVEKLKQSMLEKGIEPPETKLSPIGSLSTEKLLQVGIT
jgi:hypothetical protein